MGKKFKVKMYCSNCKNISVHTFPFGSEITRLAAGGGTVVRSPRDEAPGWKHVKVSCPHCGSEKIR